ncbi:response regulator, partial [Bacillus paranthracis]|nr:response regulator [Bacillus paranthracis]
MLVVDDATFIRDLVKRVLRTRMPNVQVEEAINGKRAIQILHKQQIDLVLCDWEMPEMSGLEVLQWMRAQDAYQKTPFIMITSRTDKEYVVQAVQAGASDYIGKPFSN